MRRLFPVLLLCGSPLVALAQAASSSAGALPTSLVNVTDVRFGAACPAGAADPLGHRDATCAVRAAVAFAEGSGIPGAGFPVLYFPHGVYKLAGEGYTSAITLTKALSIEGDGAAGTVLLNTSAKAALLTYLQAKGCGGKPGPCPLSVQGLTFAGQGSATAGGLIEIDSSDTGSMRNVVLTQTGGIALNLQGSSERWYFSDMEISNARWPVLLEGDTNETYFDRVNVLEGGEAGDYCYSIDCPGGKRIASGVWQPDPHSAVYLDGDNVHWMNSSIKSTEAIGGLRLSTTTSSIAHSYIEGYPWGGQPRVNHAIAAPGKSELGHLTRGISATELDMPVDDADWQPLHVNDPAQARINGTHSYVSGYGIFPADYQLRSTAPSRAVPGITRGTMELLQMGSFSGDGQGHALRRGKGAVAWPAGSVIEQVAANSYGVLRLEENHFNSLATDFKAPYSSGCSDTEQRQTWVSSPSKLCAEVIAGLVPDGFMVPFPSDDYVHNNFTLALVGNSIYTGGTEADGEGWIKIPGNATVQIDQGNPPLRTFVDAATALHTYANGATRVQVVEWPRAAGKSAWALAYVVDPSAGVRFSPQDNFYTADVMRDGALAHQYLGAQCWYNTGAASAMPDRRTCTGANGVEQAVLAGGRWASAGGTTGPAASAGPVAAGANPLKYVVRGWQVNHLSARGQDGDCQSREEPTGAVRLSTAADATLIVNLSPNPGAQVMSAGVVEGDGTRVAVRVCNTGNQPVQWQGPPEITLTQLP